MQMIYNSINEIIDACYQYLQSHLMQGERFGKKYHYYKPANTKYGPHQWLWDSGWHMIAWSYKEPQNAIIDLRTMLQFQQPSGFIPEICFWGGKTFLERIGHFIFGYSHEEYTDLTQMPMLPYSVRAMWNATHDKTVLEEFVPKLVKYFDWWAKERDPDHDGLVSIVHGWESGIDASPLYDPAHGVKNPTYKELYPKFLTLQRIYRNKYHWDMAKILESGLFNFEDIGVCAVYAAGWGELSRLANEFDPKLAQYCNQQSEKFETAIIKKAWDPARKQFVSFYHTEKEEKISTIKAHQCLFPLMLDRLPKEMEDTLVSDLQNPTTFWAHYPIPSVAMNEETFNPNRNRLLWRGTVWPCTVWFVCEGLMKHHRMDVLHQIVDRWIEMYQKNGIWEYYNPLTGEGFGEEGIGMSAVLIDMLYRLKKI